LLLELFLVVKLCYLMLLSLHELQDVVSVVDANKELEAHALLHGLDELTRLYKLSDR
jgi:hypothetical protein